MEKTKKGTTQINIDMTTKEKLTRLILEESYKRNNKISMDKLVNLLLEEYKEKV